eukprot:gene1603-1943_t
MPAAQQWSATPLRPGAESANTSVRNPVSVGSLLCFKSRVIDGAHTDAEEPQILLGSRVLDVFTRVQRGLTGRSRQLDVNRAVQLLKLTATRSNKKNSSKLPPWFTRTRDVEESSWDADASAASSQGRADMAGSWDSDGNLDAGDSSASDKEQERQFRRAVFSFDRWAAHRSTSRYIRHFRGIFSSRTFQGLLQPMAFFSSIAALAGVVLVVLF